MSSSASFVCNVLSSLFSLAQAVGRHTSLLKPWMSRLCEALWDQQMSKPAVHMLLPCFMHPTHKAYAAN